jgi:hypothetical protein
MIEKLENLYFAFIMIVLVVAIIYTIYDWATGAL